MTLDEEELELSKQLDNIYIAIVNEYHLRSQYIVKRLFEIKQQKILLQPLSISFDEVQPCYNKQEFLDRMAQLPKLDDSESLSAIFKEEGTSS
jgi:hypothetical protein